MSILRSLSLALLAAPATAADAPSPYPPRAIVMFVADWCAPCHAEVARLDEVAAAARPWRVLVAEGDDPARPGRLWRSIAPAARWQPATATVARMRRELLGDVAGLPYSIAFDADGRKCADSRRGLDTPRTRTLVAACGAP